MPQLLNMVATVSDKATGPLAAISKSISGLARTGSHDLKGLGGILDGLGKDLRGFAIPALEAFGVTSLSLTGIVGGLGKALEGFGSDAVALERFSAGTRLSVDAVEEFQAVASALNVSGANEGLDAFAKHMEDIKAHTPEAYAMMIELQRRLAPEIYTKLDAALNSGNFNEELKVTIGLMKDLDVPSQNLVANMLMSNPKMGAVLAAFDAVRKAQGPI